jgi:uncharacterized protein (DUF1778 family)
MTTFVGKSERRHDRKGEFRDQRVFVTLDEYEYLLIKIAARMCKMNITDFIREGVIDKALVAVDTGRKIKVAKKKGVPLYGHKI